jgi:hypothetical protein
VDVRSRKVICKWLEKQKGEIGPSEFQRATYNEIGNDAILFPSLFVCELFDEQLGMCFASMETWLSAVKVLPIS